jgi:dTDP-4-dehydrorhamnose 3,5-epimerase
LWNDPEIGIEWPILNGTTPSMSQKDMDASALTNADVFQ